MTEIKAKKSLNLIKRPYEFISYAVDGLYKLRGLRILFDLMPQIFYMCVNRPVITLEIKSLRYGRKLVTRKNSARILCESEQYPELGRRTYNRASFQCDLIVIYINNKTTP